jgi:hypothetical protein
VIEKSDKVEVSNQKTTLISSTIELNEVLPSLPERNGINYVVLRIFQDT